MTIESFWIQVNESNLRQGDYLTSCLVPISIFKAPGLEEEILEVEVQERDLIVLTQSCDLDNRKARSVALCPIYSLQEFETVNPDFQKKGRWNEVRKGRVEGLHLLASSCELDCLLPSQNLNEHL
jgi:hypothetical protein